MFKRLVAFVKVNVAVTAFKLGVHLAFVHRCIFHRNVVGPTSLLARRPDPRIARALLSSSLLA
jgi:hypothetical protein